MVVESSVGLLDRSMGISVDQQQQPGQASIEEKKPYGIVSMFNSSQKDKNGIIFENNVFQYDDGGCYDTGSCYEDECDSAPAD